MRPCSKTIPLAQIHPFTKQMVPSLCPELLTQSLSRIFDPKLVQIIFACFSYVPAIKGFLPSITLLHACHFFLVCFFVSFSSHTFLWACVNTGSFSPFVHSLVCQITRSFLNGFQPNLCQHFSHAYSTHHTIFSLK